MDNKTPKQRSDNMRKIKNKDSTIEIKLRKALWNSGIRYRKNYSKLPGKPDIVLTKHRIAIFCDSEFFHGKDWSRLKQQLKNSDNSDFWIKKISRNIERDNEVNQELENLGWTVIRFWGKEILKNVDDCVEVIKKAMYSVKNESIGGVK